MNDKHLSRPLKARLKRLTVVSSTALLLWLASTPLSGCAHDKQPLPPAIKTDPVPQSFLTCPSPAPIPDSKTSTQADLDASYEDTFNAWDTCYHNLAHVRALLAPAAGIKTDKVQLSPH